MLPLSRLLRGKKLKNILDVTTNVVVVVFAVVAIGVLVKNYLAPVPNGSPGCGSCSAGPSGLD